MLADVKDVGWSSEAAEWGADAASCSGQIDFRLVATQDCRGGHASTWAVPRVMELASQPAAQDLRREHGILLAAAAAGLP